MGDGRPKTRDIRVGFALLRRRGLVRPGKIIGVGRNYVDHAAELGNAVPERPLLFFKPPTAVIGDGDPIVLPPESAQVDFEAEIGVVIGTRLRRGSEAQARAAIAGITCVNDVTARDIQRREEQWARAKGFDTFCPVGPRVVPVEPNRLPELEVVCRVNGRERQRARASQMTFGIVPLVAYVSQAMTLEPGDLIATGTPAGVGPLQPGDVVEVEIPGGGTLGNPGVAGGAAPGPPHTSIPWTLPPPPGGSRAAPTTWGPKPPTSCSRRPNGSRPRGVTWCTSRSASRTRPRRRTSSRRGGGGRRGGGHGSPARPAPPRRGARARGRLARGGGAVGPR